MRLIPAIDIINGQCVRLCQGDYEQSKVYESDPLKLAKSFEDNGLKYLHLVDLDGTKQGAVKNWDVIKKLTKGTNLKIDFGGGVKKEEDVNRLFDLGVAQINVGSLAVKEPMIFQQWLSKYGSEKIILSADVRNEKIHIGGWMESSEISIFDLVKDFISSGLKYVVCTDIVVDGMLTGPNIELYEKLQNHFPDLSWIASGGISSTDDLKKLASLKLDGAIIGKALYENRITLTDLNQLNLSC